MFSEAMEVEAQFSTFSAMEATWELFSSCMPDLRSVCLRCQRVMKRILLEVEVSVTCTA